MSKYLNRSVAGILLVLIVALFVTTAIADQVAVGTKGMVASAHELASAAGAEILAAGGNAVDAAVATAFAITVVEPNASGLGGEGYMVLSLADGRDLAIDYRSWAPGHVTINTDRSAYAGPESTCIPGVVAGLTLALQEYGTMTLRQVMAPAIGLAREGFPLDDVLLSRLSDVYEALGNDPVAGPIYYPDGLIPEPGSLVVNEDLAHALDLVAEQGAYAFYRGEIADAIIEAMGGWFTSADLQRYQAVERGALVSEYRGYTVIGTPPIVAGIVVAEALNILDNFDLSACIGWDDPEAVHLISQALLLASADRKPYVGDPDFYDIPIDGLLSEEYARLRADLIDPEQAITPTYSAPVGNPYYLELVAPTGAIEGEGSWSTTQISVLDRDGNSVSITQTLSSFWGSRDMIPGYGFFMNNELHNLNAYNPDNPDDVNVIGPYKRPRTVIAPTIVRDPDGEVYLVLGTPGAGRIPSTLVETIVNVIDFGMSLEEAIKAPKFCSRVAYKELRMEGGYSEETIAALEAKGHTIKATYGELNLYFGGMNAIIVEDGTMIGVGSFRRSGGAAGP
ncbi:gamma-glutamyltransferase [Candidatus Bipolaricaulota bacterium]|nr:gamma-glutamyltransferase [Candidatus Bipolaricaulota bacterium]